MQGRAQYRLETSNPKSQSPKYYLIKDVTFKGKKSKIKKYISSKLPTDEDIENFSRKFAFEIENKAAKKIADMANAYYDSDYLGEKYIRTIEEFRVLYKRFTDFLTTNEIEKYEQQFEICYIQGTTSIEGNTFSVEETHNLIVDGISPKEKSLREINEIQNFKKVKAYRDKHKGKVSINFIKNLHSLIMDNIDLESGGAFRRTDDIGIRGCDLRVTPSVVIENELEEIVNEYYSNINKRKHPFEQALMFHYKFEIIHPFADGNGRVGREVLNYMLNKEGYPRLLFLGEERETYIAALKLGNEGRYDEMIKILVDIIIDQRINVIKENLKKVIVPPKKTTQRKLTDYEVA